MKTPEQFQAEIDSLTAMNLRLQLELTKALEAFAQERRKNLSREAA